MNSLEAEVAQTKTLDDNVKKHILGLGKRAGEGYVPDLTEIPLLQDYASFLHPDHLRLLESEGKTEGDKRIIATISIMPPELMMVLDKNFHYPRELFKQYVQEQVSWIRTARQMENGRVGEEKRKNEDYFLGPYVGKGTPQVYRVFFALKHSNQMERAEKVSLPVFSQVRSSPEMATWAA